MRWTLAVLTSALLSSAATAQSLQPGLDTALPQIALAPAIELPVAAIGPATAEHRTSATTAPEALPLSPVSPVAAVTETPASPAIAPDGNSGDHTLGKAPTKREQRLVRSRSGSAAKVRSHAFAFQPGPAPTSYSRSYEVRRDVGRFLPPVF